MLSFGSTDRLRECSCPEVAVTVQRGILVGAFDIQSGIEIKFDEILSAILRCSAYETDKTICSLSVMNPTTCLHVAYNSVVQLLKGQNWRCKQISCTISSW